MVLGDIRTCRALLGSGGSATLSVTDDGRWRGGDGTRMRLRVPEPLVNIAHIPKEING